MTTRTGFAVGPDGRLHPVVVHHGPGEARSGTVCGTTVATASALEAEAARRRAREQHAATVRRWAGMAS